MGSCPRGPPERRAPGPSCRAGTWKGAARPDRGERASLQNEDFRGPGGSLGQSLRSKHSEGQLRFARRPTPTPDCFPAQS